MSDTLPIDPSTESGWASFSDAHWNRLCSSSGFKRARFRELALSVLGHEDPWAATRKKAPAPPPVTVRSSTSTKLRPRHGGRRRMVLAIAGSGWGKTTFMRGAEHSGLRVADIDDFIKHDAKAKDMRMAAARGEISWSDVGAYTHEGTADRLVAYNPDVLLAHGPNIGGGVRHALSECYALEEWWITPPAIDEVVTRVRARAKPGGEDRAELMARVNFEGLKKAEKLKGAVAVRQGSWTELWNRLLGELMTSVGPGRGVSDKVLAVCKSLGGSYAKRSARFTGRVLELGSLGSYLSGLVCHHDLIDRRDIEADILHMGQARLFRGEMSICAYSLLCMDFPVQVAVGFNTVETILDAAIKPLPTVGRPKVDIWDRDQRRRAYPLKTHPGATNKVNVYANEVFARAHDFVPNLCESLLEMTAFQEGFSDDQLSSTIMFAVAINPYCGYPATMATRTVRDPQGAKALSNALKSLGLNSHPLGAMICEADSLQGRGTIVPKELDDAEYRVGGEKLESKMHTLPIDPIRRAIRKALDRECPTDLEFEGLEDFWQRRYEWCVNGAHSKLIEKLHPGLVPEDAALKGRQVHRRVFAERLVWEPVSGWDGKSYFSLSWKLECGKTRAIYSGDSLTYFAFEHLLKPVERAWKNRRVILDPGGIGTWKIGKRIRAMHKTGPVHVMLDYDDFNSRHRLSYMKVLMEELCSHVGYPPDMADRLVASFDEWELLVGGKVLGRVEGTLMSGHRGTTFINSMLNEAYIAACYPGIYDLQSMHVGDDVYVSAPSYRVAQDLLTSCSDGGLAMNPLKQSVGVYSAEFLRVCYGERCARGYVCRSIGTCVNGNWANEGRLSGEEGLKSIIGHGWTLCNRAANFSMGALLVSSVKRICRISSSHARDLLCGSKGLRDGPVRANGTSVQTLVVDVDESEIEDGVSLAAHGLGDHATTDFLTYCATPLEQYVLGEIGSDVKETMKCASYRKTMISTAPDAGPRSPARTKVVGQLRPVRTTVRLEEATRDVVEGGYLRPFTLLQLVRKRMSLGLIAMALAMVGVVPTYTSHDEVLAWGPRSQALSVQGCLTYTDAASLCGRCTKDLVYTDYNYYA